jgi:hypothetical protein
MEENKEETKPTEETQEVQETEEVEEVEETVKENPKPIIEEHPLSEDELTEKKLHLMQCEIQKIESDLEVEELTAQLDSKIPMRFLDDDIAEVKKQIETKKKEDKDLTEADLEYLRIQLKKLEKAKEQDVPMRKIRLKLHHLQYQKGKMDAPENQIKKLQKEIREKKAKVLIHRRPLPTGV